MKYCPVFDNILVEVLSTDKVTESGIHIPSQSTEMPKMGKVLSTGKNCKEIMEGDIVYYGHYGHANNIDSTNLWLMKETDVLAVLTV